MLLPDDMQSIIDSIGQEVLINGIAANVVITNPAFNEYEERYIHSIQNVSRGSIIDYEGKKYICVTESITKRGGKYKVLARHCNTQIEKRIYTYVYLGDDDFGDPVYGDVYDHSEFVDGIADNKSFSINSSSAWRYPENQIEIIIQDTPTNRTLFDTNEEIKATDKWWKVLNHDYSKTGMIIMTCENTTAPIGV